MEEDSGGISSSSRGAIRLDAAVGRRYQRTPLDVCTVHHAAVDEVQLTVFVPVFLSGGQSPSVGSRIGYGGEPTAVISTERCTNRGIAATRSACMWWVCARPCLLP